ncbi:hypothetical protein GSR05_28650 (plasmid) [Klebsiella pneumoniae]|nr:hypothetical protein GSR05_28650 [Klebsiella pneumoniae]
MKVYGHQHSSEVFSGKLPHPVFEPKAEKLIAFHGKDASYAITCWPILKAAGASYTRRNIIADMFRRLGVE